jgi:hypothetical protein
MAGRKRKPTKLHLIQGTVQPCRMNKNEPKAPLEAPNCAIDLGSRVAFWYGIVVGRLQSIGVASITDSESVMLLAMRLNEVEERDADIKRDGAVYAKLELIEVPGEDGKTVIKAQKALKANPAVSQRSEAMRHAQALLAEFGLSPAARPKVSKSGNENIPQSRWEALI